MFVLSGTVCFRLRLLLKCRPFSFRLFFFFEASFSPFLVSFLIAVSENTAGGFFCGLILLLQPISHKEILLASV